jgi:hypothetical protein
VTDPWGPEYRPVRNSLTEYPLPRAGGRVEVRMLDGNGGKLTAARRNAPVKAVLLVVSLCIGASAPAAETAADTAAVWVPKEINFVYVGFTTKYTCDGLQAKMRGILLELGARDDLKVMRLGCMRTNTPETTPGVRIVMHVLQPVSAASGQSVAAHWKSVDVLADRNVVDAALDCELIWQLNRDVLPLFAARHVDYSSACAANKALIGGTRLKADVLVPEQDAVPKTASAR